MRAVSDSARCQAFATLPVAARGAAGTLDLAGCAEGRGTEGGCEEGGKEDGD